MRILVDGDSCPADRRILLQRVAQRTNSLLIFALQRTMRMKQPPFPLTLCDNVDNYLLREARPEDVVITRDLPLAAQLVGGGIMVIDFCGRTLSSLYIAEDFARRTDMTQQTSSRHRSNTSMKGCRKQFADALDRLARR